MLTTVLVPLVLIAAMVTFTTGFKSCNAASVNNASPPEQRDAIRTLAKSSDDIAGGIKLTISTKRALAKEKLLAPDEELTLTTLLADVNRSGTEYNNVLTGISADTSENRTRLLNALDAFAASVARLDTEGVMHLKSEAARQRAELAVNSIRASIAVIRVTLASAPPPTPAAASPSPAALTRTNGDRHD
jgi:hypothetical protein